ncbi:MAG: nicotinate-nucleotide pyrophosphorylase (carboxylating) [Thermoproteota archaeon]|jgi:nicotinate-nucleotide pyrophosphorylase (carboxylating)
MKHHWLKDLFDYSFKEDDLNRNIYYINSLPKDAVACALKIKSDCVLSGLPFFFECFSYLGYPVESCEEIISKYEGKALESGCEINFSLPFNIVLTGERIGLNLLQHASSIATHTNQFVKMAGSKGIKILDTRKTTPGLRNIEKYAVRTGGGFNHRYGQSDTWMVKDNHKSFFGGLDQAIKFFKEIGSFYNSMVVEIHSLIELKEAMELGVKHVMLDNFAPDDIREAVKIKNSEMTYEVSGGIRLDTLESFLIEGVDAISVGSITYAAPHVDISLKYGL